MCKTRFSERTGTPLFDSRLIGVGKNTVVRYGVRAGRDARQLHDELASVTALPRIGHGPHRACPGGVEASAQEGLVSPSPPPPGLPRWSGGFCTRTVGPLLFRPHRACPGGAGACASALGERRTTPLVHKPRSTGASPVGTTDGASQVLVHKPPLHRGKPGGGGGGHRAVEKGRVRLQQTTQEETRLNADPGHRGVDGNAPRKTDGVV